MTIGMAWHGNYWHNEDDGLTLMLSIAEAQRSATSPSETPTPTSEAGKRLSSLLKLHLPVIPRTSSTEKHHEQSFCFPGVALFTRSAKQQGSVMSHYRGGANGSR
jgi:hypothetical protein